MKRTTLALLLLACLSAPALPYSDSDIKKMFDQSVATQDMKLRHSLREKIAQASPASAYGIVSKAYLLNAAGVLPPMREIAMYSEAIRLDPGIFVAYFNRGLTYNRLGAADKGAADFTKVLELKPEYQGAYESRGESYRNMGKKDLALADFAKALSLDPKDDVAYLNRGVLYQENKVYLKAVEDFSEAMRLNPGLYAAYLDRCAAYTDLREYGKAMKDCDKAIELEPGNQMAYVSRGSLNIQMDRPDQAIADREKVVEIMPDNGHSWSSLCNAYERAYKFEKAVSACRRAVNLEPDYNLPYYNLCDTYVSSRQYKLAGDTADYWLEKNPGDKFMLNCKGTAAAVGGRPLEGIKVYDKIIASGNDDFSARIVRADAYTDAGKFDLAKAEVEAASAKKGAGVMDKLAEARILYRSGSKKKAAMLFNNTLVESLKAFTFVSKATETNDGHYSEKWLADMKALLKQYDQIMKSADKDENTAAPEETAEAGLSQDQCFCLYYTGQIPPYFIARFDPPKPGCENVKFKPDKLSPGITGLHPCPNQKKQGE